MGHAHHALAHAPAAMDVLGFLMLGLLGGVGHCVGMCSPFVLFVSRRYVGAGQGHSVRSAQLWYTAGRIGTYTALGAMAGALGSLVQGTGALFGVQRAAAIVAGSMLLVWGLTNLLGHRVRAVGAGGAERVQVSRPGNSLPPAWFARVMAVAHTRALGHPLAMGLLLGLLPCGLLYSALIAASARGTLVGGALGAAVFGLGTTPALFGVSLADTLLTRNRATLNQLSQAFALVMGAWFLWHGLAG